MNAGYLLRKGLQSLRQTGLRATWYRVRLKLNQLQAARAVAPQLTPTPEALAAERAHRFAHGVTFSIAVPLYNTPLEYLKQMIESVRSQTYADWQLCMADGSDEEHRAVGDVCRAYAQLDERICYRHLERNEGISGNSNGCLDMATGAYIGLLDHDDLLHPSALFEIMRVIETTEADFVYTDEATFQKTLQNLTVLHYKPDYAPDTLRGNNYICHFSVFRRSLLEQAGRFDSACDGSQDHDFILRLTETAQRIVHIPRILYFWRAHEDSVAGGVEAKPYVLAAGVRAVEGHLARMGLKGTVSPLRPTAAIYRVRYALTSEPLVSIVICLPQDGSGLKNLRTCLRALFEKTTYTRIEVILVVPHGVSADGNSPVARLCRAYDAVRMVSGAPAAGIAACYNQGARQATGTFLVMLSPHVAAITPDWLQELLMFAQRSDVGIVGAKLLYPNGTIRHAGVALGVGTLVGYYCQGQAAAQGGYMGRLSYAQDLSAVSGDCLMVCREVWERLGGFDEAFPARLYDIDLCLRVRREGLLVVWTPFAELSYRGFPVVRGWQRVRPPHAGAFSRSDAASDAGLVRFRTRWQAELSAGDPYYNPNFSQDDASFTICGGAQEHDVR